MEESILESLPKEKISRKKFVKLCAFGIGSLAINSALLSSFSSAAYAHPPSDIIITFDKDAKVVSAVIKHSVSNPANHFIKKVDVSLNGKDIIEHDISRQENNQTESVSYRIPDAKEGDIIGVKAYCSISGKLKKEIKVLK